MLMNEFKIFNKVYVFNRLIDLNKRDFNISLKKHFHEDKAYILIISEIAKYGAHKFIYKINRNIIFDYKNDIIAFKSKMYIFSDYYTTEVFLQVLNEEKIHCWYTKDEIYRYKIEILPYDIRHRALFDFYKKKQDGQTYFK